MKLRNNSIRYVHSLAANTSLWIIFVCILAVGFLVWPMYAHDATQHASTEQTSMLFVGDVMLARNVELLMRQEGILYPFSGVRDMFADHTYVVGNFEASIPEHHTPTPSFTFRFSVDRAMISVLEFVGVTDMSLANNHTFDAGSTGLASTREALWEFGIQTIGDPNELTTEHVAYRNLGDVRVALVGLNATYRAPDVDVVAQVLDEVSQQSDVQIVMMHWGEEYALTASATQQALAYALIDAGADAIIGHHPHVVQNIDVYRNAPIFYSLGNFIFDQYWNDDVREGLAVSLSFTDDKVRYELIPVTSIDLRSSPRPMSRTERTEFLAELSERSDADIEHAIKKGEIVRLFTPHEYPTVR